MKAAEHRHYAKLVEIGCIVCRGLGYETVPEIHHLRAHTGMSVRGHWLEAIPLCPAHHRGLDHPNTASIHLDKARFIALYGTERELLEKVNALLIPRSK